ncbi:MAG: DegT/DnrJ/EryC1/StrS family aminotransferase, partial [Pseudohongiella sp.]|nr:DegT/DnrJ/EryC1/StrS family aminotransferase [Pseudohongiella sp.]
SLHATKLLNTGEGGGCISSTSELVEKLKRIRFFGHDDIKDIVEDGFNGKMTEIHAALGLANLKYYDHVLELRKSKYHLYLELFSDIKSLKFQNLRDGLCNYSYFPMIFESEEILLKVEQELNKAKIYPRRYFYPSVNTYQKVIDYKSAPVSEEISKTILCMPLYSDLSDHDIILIAGIVKGCL